MQPSIAQMRSEGQAGDMSVFAGLFRTARSEGLGVTLHIAEVRSFLFGRVPRFLPPPPLQRYSKEYLKEFLARSRRGAIRRRRRRSYSAVNLSDSDTRHIWTTRRGRSCWHGGRASRFVLRPISCASFPFFALHSPPSEATGSWQMQNGAATPRSPHPVLPCSEPPHRHLCTSFRILAHSLPLLTLKSGPFSLISQTDDILPFRNSILGEYALLMAPKPLGLGLTESEVETVARMGMECRFRNTLP